MLLLLSVAEVIPSLSFIFFFFFLQVFHIGVCWWSLTGVWMSVSLLRSPWFFCLLSPILTMLLFRWSCFFLLFTILRIPLQIPEVSLQGHQLQLLASYSTLFTFSGKIQAFDHLFGFFSFSFYFTDAIAKFRRQHGLSFLSYDKIWSSACGSIILIIISFTEVFLNVSCGSRSLKSELQQVN